MWLDHEEEEMIAFRLKILGEEKVLLLKARARTPARYIDKVAIKLYLQEQLARLTEKP